MERDPAAVQLLMDQFYAALRRAGVRLTPQRMEVFREVARSEDHPDAETVYRAVHARMPSVSLDTVYRTLCLFVDLGLLANMTPHHERMRYDANTRPHCHFVCTVCGLARDFDCDAIRALAVPDSAKAFGTVQSAHVELRGTCLECLAAAQRLGEDPPTANTT